MEGNYIQGKLEWFYFDNTGAMINYNVSIGEEYTMYFQSNGVWLYTVSLIKWDLVDQGKHLDWGGTSVYLSGIASAVGKWNSYKSNVIRRSNITNAQDVTLSDYYTTTNTNAYTTQGGQMVFNTFRMSNFSNNQRIAVIMHEFGHALGLGHNSQLDIMYEGTPYVSELSKSDKKSYDMAYKRY